MAKVKGKFCGDFKPPKEPFQAAPFFGKYARGGGRNTGNGFGQQGTGTQQYYAPVPTTPAPTTPDTGKKPGKGNGNNKPGKFNPDLYESPPQGAPPTAQPPAAQGGDPAGGAPAPNG
jgi:hypothetical protein